MNGEIDNFSVLTQKKKCESHRETKVTIDWSGITTDQLRIMARAYIVHVIQSQWRHTEVRIPEFERVLATSMVHQEIFLPREYKVREKKSPLDQWIAELDPNDVQGLLAQLQGG